LLNIKRFLVSLTLISVFTTGAVHASGQLGGTSETTTTSVPVTEEVSTASVAPTSTATKIHPELIEQLRTRKAGSVKFWEAVSWCETNHNWNDGGYYAGGLGIAKSAWRGYGGRQFAPTPKGATKEEQIIVANRISFLGFQTKNIFRTLDDKMNNRPFFRPAIGWRNSKNWGKGCINWKTRKPLRERYTEAGMAEWKKTRPGYKAPSGKVSSQSVAGSKNKRCPQWEARLKANGLVPVKKFSYIMWRESRCQEKVVSDPNSNGTRDYGLLQINSSWRTVTSQVCGSKLGNMKVLLNHKCNLKVAKYLLDNGGLGHWKASSGKE
jgi:hypothetical protein